MERLKQYIKKNRPEENGDKRDKEPANKDKEKY
jgi:hypothetical protein